MDMMLRCHLLLACSLSRILCSPLSYLCPSGQSAQSSYLASDFAYRFQEPLRGPAKAVLAQVKRYLKGHARIDTTSGNIISRIRFTEMVATLMYEKAGTPYPDMEEIEKILSHYEGDNSTQDGRRMAGAQRENILRLEIERTLESLSRS